MKENKFLFFKMFENFNIVPSSVSYIQMEKGYRGGFSLGPTRGVIVDETLFSRFKKLLNNEKLKTKIVTRERCRWHPACVCIALNNGKIYNIDCVSNKHAKSVFRRVSDRLEEFV